MMDVHDDDLAADYGILRERPKPPPNMPAKPRPRLAPRQAGRPEVVADAIARARASLQR